MPREIQTYKNTYVDSVWGHTTIQIRRGACDQHKVWASINITYVYYISTEQIILGTNLIRGLATMNKQTANYMYYHNEHIRKLEKPLHVSTSCREYSSKRTSSCTYVAMYTGARTI